jgi:hypothetical protein
MTKRNKQVSWLDPQQKVGTKKGQPPTTHLGKSSSLSNIIFQNQTNKEHIMQQDEEKKEKLTRKFANGKTDLDH